jgi:hypothetical protein
LEGGGMMRERGRGSVTTTKGGRFRARLRLGGRAIVDEVFDTEAEAIEILDAARFELDRTQTAIATAPTLESWSREWWTRRETDGVHRSVKTERYVWATWIESAPFYSIPLGDIDRHAIRGWVRTLERAKSKRTGERISRQTAVHALNLVLRCVGFTWSRSTRVCDRANFGRFAGRMSRSIRRGRSFTCGARTGDRRSPGGRVPFR